MRRVFQWGAYTQDPKLWVLCGAEQTLFGLFFGDGTFTMVLCGNFPTVYGILFSAK